MNDQQLKAKILEWGRVKSVLTLSEILEAGANLEQIAEFVNLGVLYPSAQGIYMPENADFTEQHTRVEVAARFPETVICLDSALNFNHITTQIPHQVWIAYEEGLIMPIEPLLPIKAIHMPQPAFSQGIEVHILEGIPVKIYNIAKTVADCFIYEHEVGIDVAVEAFEQSILQKRCTIPEILKYTQGRHMRDYVVPYFEECVAKASKVLA
jgi:predicted transcriptional regulator of viral defense system